MYGLWDCLGAMTCAGPQWWLVAAIGILAFGAFAAVAIMLVDLGRDAMWGP